MPNKGPTILCSVIASGWQSEYANTPMNGAYVDFSVEELFTIDTENVDSTDR